MSAGTAPLLAAAPQWTVAVIDAPWGSATPVTVVRFLEDEPGGWNWVEVPGSQQWTSRGLARAGARITHLPQAVAQ